MPNETAGPIIMHSSEVDKINQVVEHLEAKVEGLTADGIEAAKNIASLILRRDELEQQVVTLSQSMQVVCGQRESFKASLDTTYADMAPFYAWRQSVTDATEDFLGNCTDGDKTAMRRTRDLPTFIAAAKEIIKLRTTEDLSTAAIGVITTDGWDSIWQDYKIKTYVVRVRQDWSVFINIDVEALDEEEAEEKGLEIANDEYSYFRDARSAGEPELMDTEVDLVQEA